MERPRLLLVAHGSQRAPSPESSLVAHARTIAAAGQWPDVEVVALHGDPRCSELAAAWAEATVLLVPLLMVDGAVSREAIPQRFDLATRPNWRVAPVVGSSPALVDLIVTRYAAVQTSETALLLVGHGSATDTEWLSRCDRDVRARVSGEVAPAWLSHGAAPATVAAGLTAPHVVVEPLLIAAGYHVLRDLPEQLEALSTRRIAIQSPIGADPRFAEVIATAAEQGLLGWR